MRDASRDLFPDSVVAPGLSSSQTIKGRQEENTHLNPLGHNRPYASVRQSVGVRAVQRGERLGRSQ